VVIQKSPEPLSRFQPDLAQIILWRNNSKIVEMTEIASLQWEEIAKELKYTDF
jgi:hypothetical protein